MNVVFMGTPEFAVPALRRLAEEHEVVAVYTRPDAPSGRGGKLRPTPVKEFALEAGIPVEQPTTLRDAAVLERLRAFEPDIIVVAAYGMILPDEVLDVAPYGCINIHASILPRWRGAAPIQRAILAGDAEVGVSIMQVVQKLDAGAYAHVVKVRVEDKDTLRLTSELASVGATALLETLERIEDGTVRWIEQDESLVTYADKIAKSDTALAPAVDAVTALRRIRASSPQAPSRISVGGKCVTVIAAEALDGELFGDAGAAPASGVLVASKSGPVLGFSDGGLLVTRVKPEGRAEMSAQDWVRGLRVDSIEWGPIS